MRNRLLIFIAKWSPESRVFESGKRKKALAPKELLDDRSLVKWETSEPENPQGRAVLRIARELIRAGHGGDMPTVLDPFAKPGKTVRFGIARGKDINVTDGTMRNRGNVLFHVVNERDLERRPILFTTNKSPLTLWGQVLHDPDPAEAIVDRTLEHGRLIVLDGPSHRTPHIDRSQRNAHNDAHPPARISGKRRSDFPEPATSTP